MLCTRPLAIHSATGLAGRDEIRGTDVGAGNDSSGSFARGQFGVEPQMRRCSARDSDASQRGTEHRRQHRRTQQRGDRGAQADIGDGRGIDDQPLAQREVDAAGQAAGARVGAGNVGNGNGRIDGGGVGVLRTGHGRMVAASESGGRPSIRR